MGIGAAAPIRPVKARTHLLAGALSVPPYDDPGAQPFAATVVDTRHRVFTANVQLCCLPRAKLLRALQVIMTFTLISTVYACGIAKPGHGSMTPLAVGFSLLACAGAGGKYSGMAAPHGTTYCVL
jgi:hypothetical protein